MATQITNQATLNYNSGTTAVSTASNIATVTLQGPLEANKYVLENGYEIGKPLTYNVFLNNTGSTTLTNLSLTDDLGTYALSPTLNVTPLTYKPQAKIFTNGKITSTAIGTQPSNKSSVTFSLGSLAPGSGLLIQYETIVNEYATAYVDPDNEANNSTITNTATITADNMTTPVVASCKAVVSSYADVIIEKTMSPDPVMDGSPLTYTFHMENSGTISATNVVLEDQLQMSPTITSVTINGSPTTDYSYQTGMFTYPDSSSGTTYTIPAATFTQDESTGVVTATPGTSTIVIEGVL